MPTAKPVLLVLMLLTGVFARHASAADEMHWMCWLGGGTGQELRCRQEDDPLLDEDPGSASSGTDLPVHPAAEPFDNPAMRRALFATGTAPNVTRLVREQPHHYRGVTWTVPLYGPPIDDARVRQLAHSVLCGSSPRCRAHFGSVVMPLHAAAR